MALEIYQAGSDCGMTVVALVDDIDVVQYLLADSSDRMTGPCPNRTARL